MKEESNTKLLGKIFIIVFIIIFIIILICLINYVFSINSHNYTIPTNTTKAVDYNYDELDNEKKYSYNQKLLDNNFLIPLNNALDNKYDFTNVDLLQSEEAKYRYIYSYYMLKEKPVSITFDKLNDYTKITFDTTLNENNFTKFKNNDNTYNYNINYANPPFCLKAEKLKTSKQKYALEVYLIDYNSPLCKANYLDYNDSNIAHKAVLTVTKNKDNYIINKFVITK